MNWITHHEMDTKIAYNVNGHPTGKTTYNITHQYF